MAETVLVISRTTYIGRQKRVDSLKFLEHCCALVWFANRATPGGLLLLDSVVAADEEVAEPYRSGAIPKRRTTRTQKQTTHNGYKCVAQGPKQERTARVFGATPS